MLFPEEQNKDTQETIPTKNPVKVTYEEAFINFICGYEPHEQPDMLLITTAKIELKHTFLSFLNGHLLHIQRWQVDFRNFTIKDKN
jgi:hypothetical protein